MGVPLNSIQVTERGSLRRQSGLLYMSFHLRKVLCSSVHFSDWFVYGCGGGSVVHELSIDVASEIMFDFLFWPTPRKFPSSFVRATLVTTVDRNPRCR